MTYTASSVTCESIGEVSCSTLSGDQNDFIALSADSKGQLYCIGVGYDVSFSPEPSLDIKEVNLYKVDKATAELTLVGALDAAPAKTGGTYIDPDTDVMYWNVVQADETSLIYKVDLETAQATPLIELTDGLVVVGMHKTPHLFDDDVPAACQNLAAQFTSGTLSGKITLTAPTTTYDGETGTGTVDITVLGNGTALATKKKVAYGESVEIDVTVPSSGTYLFSVYASNDKGNGPKRHIENVWCGPNIPATPAPVLDFNYLTNTMSLSWPAVTKGENGGSINADGVTYKVTRYDGTVAVASTASTSFSEVITQPDSPQAAYYEVVAIADGVSSAAGKSNSFVVGAATEIPPYKAYFTTSVLKSWTIIDANNDGQTWKIGSSCVIVDNSSANAKDDWLITPPIKMEAGLTYKVNVVARCYTTDSPERFEVKLGNQPKVASMTTAVIDATAVNDISRTTFSGTVTADADGRFYIGVHAISDANMRYLYVDELSVEAGLNLEGPAAPVVVSASPSTKSPYVADFTVTAPTKDYQGADLESLTKLEVYRAKGTLAKTFENPEPGETLNFSDTVAVTGDYTYTFVAYSAKGRGAEAYEDIHVGYSQPKAVANAIGRRTANLGELKLSWSAVEYDINGLKFDAPSKYILYKYDEDDYAWRTYGDELIADTVKIIKCPESPQTIPQFQVAAYFDGQTGKPVVIDPVPVGKPLTKLVETFANETFDEVWAPCDGSVNIASARLLGDMVQSSDDGSGFLLLSPESGNSGASVNIQSSLVSLKGAKTPAVTLDVFNLFKAAGIPVKADENCIVVSARTSNDYKWKELYSKTVAEICGDTGGWTRVIIDMSAYNDSVVQIKIGADFNAYIDMVIIDHITLDEFADKDLAVAKVTAPSKVKNGKSFTIEAKVINAGLNAIDAYTVQLYADEEFVKEQSGESLAVSNSATHKFDVTMSQVVADSVTYTVKAVYALDGNVKNNEADVVVKVEAPKLPKVTNLTATKTDGTVNLTWTAPNYTDQGTLTEITEGFEDGTALDDTYGDWTFVDVDQAIVYDFNNWFTKNDGKGSFLIWDIDVLDVGDFPLADNHTSKKFIFSMYRLDNGQVDDWAISPLLGRKAQTIKFYAASIGADYRDDVEVLYSTSTEGVDLNDFTAVEGWPVTVPNSWTQYSVNLPEGATYFALRNNTTNGTGLYIDDVTFTPANFPFNLVLVGYNVYRNGVKLNQQPVEQCKFDDEAAARTSSVIYTVTAVYEIYGESAGVNFDCKDIPSGVENVSTDSHVTIAQQGGELVIGNAEGLDIAVATANGMIIYQGRATTSHTTVNVVPGIYIVRVGSTVAKIIVK